MVDLRCTARFCCAVAVFFCGCCCCFCCFFFRFGFFEACDSSKAGMGSDRRRETTPFMGRHLGATTSTPFPFARILDVHFVSFLFSLTFFLSFILSFSFSLSLSLLPSLFSRLFDGVRVWSRTKRRRRRRRRKKERATWLVEEKQNKKNRIEFGPKRLGSRVAVEADDDVVGRRRHGPTPPPPRPFRPLFQPELRSEFSCRCSQGDSPTPRHSHQQNPKKNEKKTNKKQSKLAAVHQSE